MHFILVEISDHAFTYLFLLVEMQFAALNVVRTLFVKQLFAEKNSIVDVMMERASSMVEMGTSFLKLLAILHQRKHKKYRENASALAPRSFWPTCTHISGCNVCHVVCEWIVMGGNKGS